MKAAIKRAFKAPLRMAAGMTKVPKAELRAAIRYVVDRHRGRENAATVEQIAEEVMVFLFARGREPPWSSIRDAERGVAGTIPRLVKEEGMQIATTSRACVYLPEPRESIQEESAISGPGSSGSRGASGTTMAPPTSRSPLPRGHVIASSRKGTKVHSSTALQRHRR